MPNKVIAIVFAHQGDNNYEQASSNATKRLLRKANKVLSEHYGHRVGTVFGDPRGRNAAGEPVLGYALCMETPKDKVAWLLETFWSGGANGSWEERCDGVGYIRKGAGRVGLYALDVSAGNAGVEDFLLQLTGQPLTLPVEVPKESKPKSKPAPGEPEFSKHLSDDDIRALLDVNGDEYPEDADRATLLGLYLAAISNELPEPEVIEIPASSDEPLEVIDVCDEATVDQHGDDPVSFDDMTKADLQAECDKRKITYRKKDTNAQLISLLS